MLITATLSLIFFFFLTYLISHPVQIYLLHGCYLYKEGGEQRGQRAFVGQRDRIGRWAEGADR